VYLWLNDPDIQRFLLEQCRAAGIECYIRLDFTLKKLYASLTSMVRADRNRIHLSLHCHQTSPPHTRSHVFADVRIAIQSSHRLEILVSPHLQVCAIVDIASDAVAEFDHLYSRATISS